MKVSKKSLISLAVSSAVAASVLISTQANADGIPGNFSANMALTTDYYFRGLSQNNNNGAIQGGFDWAHDSGVYAGVWSSAVSFGSINLETDTYVGFSREVSGFTYDLGWIKYNYNDSPASSNPEEFYVNLSYSFLTAGYAYSPDWFGTGEVSNYAYLAAEYDAPYGIGVSASVAKSFGDVYKKSYGQNIEFVDYKIGINKDFAGVNIDLSYVGNDLNNSQCGAYGYTTNQCDGSFVLTASKAIDDTSSSSDELPISANVTLVTDYYFRGISQTNNDGAIQGGLDWSHESGLYAGIWTSNVAFGATTIEADTYVGYANEIDGLGYDLGFIRYNYTETNGHDDPNEYYVNLSYGIVTAGYAYSPSWFGSSLNSNYLSTSVDYSLPKNFGITASLGYSFGDAYKRANGNGVDNFDFFDYKIGINKDLAGINFDLSYVGTDLQDQACTSYGYTPGNCSGRFTLAASKGF